MNYVEVIFDELAYKEYSLLQKNVLDNKKTGQKPTYEQLLSSINKTINNLKSNPHFGDLIPKKYLSKKLINKYGTDKIFRVKLVGYWRLLYTVIGEETKIIAFILEFMNHDNYNKLLGYRKK